MFASLCSGKNSVRILVYFTVELSVVMDEFQDTIV